MAKRRARLPAPTLARNHVVVDLDNVRHRHILNHVFDARRKGQPRVLHIRRYEATANRRESLRGIPTKPRYDRHEYPPAMSNEGGKEGRRALRAERRKPQRRLSDASSACSVLQRAKVHFRNEQRFIFERWPNR